MSRSSRRKTLSHSEIENFLSEISLPKQVDESLPETSPVSVDEPFISCAELISTQNANQTEPDEVIWIRELCKLKFSSPAVQSMSHMKRLEIGRHILHSSNYRILPTRMLRPDLYDHPSSSLEGKKKLLLSLSPMLTDNEAQRKADISACEEFTRCRSGKGKGRLCNYEYTDLDTNVTIDHAEFERRYLNFVKANKPKSYDLSGGVARFSPTVDPNVLMTNKIPDLLEVYNLETPSVYVKEVSIKKKSELIQFDSMVSGKENVANFHCTTSSAGGSSSSNIMPSTEATDALYKPPSATSSSLSSSLNSLVPKKSKENDRKRKNNTFGSERRVTLSPATARAMMLKAFEEDEPTVFPACPVFDYDLGSNSMVSPSRLLIKEFKSPDVFSNPKFIDNDEEDNTAASSAAGGASHLAVKLFIDELPVETSVKASAAESAQSVESGAVSSMEMDVEKTDEEEQQQREIVVEVQTTSSLDTVAAAAPEVVLIDLTTESSVDSVLPEQLPQQMQMQGSVDAAAKSASLQLEQELDDFSKELDGILANEDDFVSSPRGNDVLFKLPAAAVEATSSAPLSLETSTVVNDVTLESVLDAVSPSAASSALDSLDALLSTDDDDVDGGDEGDIVGSDAPSLEFLASVAAHQSSNSGSFETAFEPVNVVDAMPSVLSDEVGPREVVEVVVPTEAVVESERPSSTVHMSEEEEEDDSELVQVLEASSDATTVESVSISATVDSSATVEPVRSTSSMLLDRENAKSVLQEAYSLLSEGASELDTFAMVETLIVKAEEESGGAATPINAVIDSALYAFCNNAPIAATLVVPSSSSGESADVDDDDDEEYPYFKPQDYEKASIATDNRAVANFSSAVEANSSSTATAVTEVIVDDSVVMTHDEEVVSASADQGVSEMITAVPDTAQTTPRPSFDDIYNDPLDYGLAQEKAYKQRLVRFEIARWKYQWELVSVKAANEAVARAKSRYNV